MDIFKSEIWVGLTHTLMPTPKLNIPVNIRTIISVRIIHARLHFTVYPCVRTSMETFMQTDRQTQTQTHAQILGSPEMKYVTMQFSEA